MSLAKKILDALNANDKQAQYENVARYLNLQYHLYGREVLQKKISEYSKKYDLSKVKLGHLIAKL